MNESFEQFSRVVFGEIFEETLETFELGRKNKEVEIKKIDVEVDLITDKIVQINSSLAISKLESKLDKLDDRKQYLLSQLDHQEQFDVEWLYEETKVLLENPSKVWDLSDPELKQILLWVRYNWKILYKKGLWVLNSETSLCNCVYPMLSTWKTVWQGVRELNP